jgi:regulatory protein YycH of two-component signal transduction system YycFG
LILGREMTIVAELMDSDFNFNSSENSQSLKVMNKRTGIKFIELFFDFINFQAGYHSLNNFEEQQDNLQKFIDFILVIDGLDYLAAQLKFSSNAD